MVAIRLPVFSGMMPALDPYVVSDKNAAYSENTWLYSGALAGLPEYVPIHTLTNSKAGIAFRIPSRMDDPTYMFDSIWMEFGNPNTSFLPAPIASDQFRRFYWTSPTEAPKYNTLQRIINGDPAYQLGLPPAPALSVVVNGGSSSTLVSRAYVATLVSEYNEEGPAGEPVVANGPMDATFDVTVQGVHPDDLGLVRDVKKINLYRTITTNAGTTNYYLVHQFTALTTPQTFSDNVSDAELASKPILESTAWTAPPHLEGFVQMPNGILAGWMKNELWFSEAYRPHAWPAAFSLSLEFDIIGLGVINQTLVVCTRGSPYTASGVNPATITTAKLAAFEPCLSRGSIISTEEGVFYTSPNGLILVNPGIAINVTRQAVSRDKWHELANQAKVRAARIGTAYYAYGAGVSRVFQEQPMFMQPDMVQTLDEQGSNVGFLIDPANDNAAISMLSSPSYVVNVMNDMWSGEALALIDGKVYWLRQEPGYQMRAFKWRSKKFRTSKLENFAAYKCFFEKSSLNPQGPINTDINQKFNPDTQYGVIRVYADNKLVSAQELRTSGRMHRLPNGFKAETWQIEFEAKVNITNFQMATSVKELQVV